jgi:hypothetical protein
MMRRRLWSAVLACVVVAGSVVLMAGPSPKFYRDDPLREDPETQDASRVTPWDVNGAYDLIENSFLDAGERRDVRAPNVNTLDEVPDSSWFTNRIGARAVAVDEVETGPISGSGPAPGTWTIVSGKNEGVTPGFRVTDARGDVYFIKFDPPANPEMATGAEVVSTHVLHALGYHVPENYIATVDPADLRIGAGATIKGDNGRERPFDASDLEAVLARSARRDDGLYRVVASKALRGTPLGPFRYHGTRPDDPNDIYHHEHRRELRGLRVYAAWLNHDETRSINTLDTLVDADGRRVVRHHLIDFGSTLGSGSTVAQKPRAGNEYIWEARPTFITMLTFGLYVRPWIKVKYAEMPAVGRFEAAYFTPERWKPEYPNAAFDNMRADDAFWAASRLVAFDDDLIRAAVKSGRYSDPEAAAYLTRTLSTRRSKILQHWLNGVLPLVDFELSSQGALTFRNVAVDAGAAQPPTEYRVRWFAFDNHAGGATPVGNESAITESRAEAPRALLAHSPEYLCVELRGVHPTHTGWASPLKAYFRRQPQHHWQLVGVERQP